MILNISDRFRLLELLARQQVNLATLGIIRKLTEKLEFSIEEIDEYGIVTDPVNGRVNWKATPEVSQEKEFEFSEKQIKYIAGLLKNFPQLTMAYFSLLNKFGVELPEDE
jgi:hypothetical protein